MGHLLHKWWPKTLFVNIFNFYFLCKERPYLSKPFFFLNFQIPILTEWLSLLRPHCVAKPSIWWRRYNNSDHNAPQWQRKAQKSGHSAAICLLFVWGLVLHMAQKLFWDPNWRWCLCGGAWWRAWGAFLPKHNQLVAGKAPAQCCVIFVVRWSTVMQTNMWVLTSSPPCCLTCFFFFCFVFVGQQSPAECERALLVNGRSALPLSEPRSLTTAAPPPPPDVLIRIYCAPF